MRKLMLTVDEISTFVGKSAAWLIVLLMLMVCTDVVRRYVLNAPSAWIGELSVMAYGALFMMCGAYTLAQNAHVRGDFLYGSMKPRTQATFDLILYITFFLPGIVALCYAGYTFAGESWRIGEHTTQIANGPPIYPFKTIIPIAGAFVLLQGLVEILRCVVCIQTGEWPERLKDAEEIDVVEQQLAASIHVDEQDRLDAIAKAKTIDEEAHHRIGQTKGELK
ncbi:MAG: TRAP transporter small permease subunit [Polynucleobacter sp.]|jgi:TRAP-type mannitol/chloroaromatic compound transport system permease small subunit|nr:TRAP transporter small permease subunit [Polynucleobacter sp.]